jgi:hypothetical protein
MNMNLIIRPSPPAFPATIHLQAADEPPVDFVKQIKPILADRCVECHNSETLLWRAQSAESRAGLRKRSTARPSHRSRRAGAQHAHTSRSHSRRRTKKAMPATGHRIPKDEVSLIKRWILEGAKWPDGPDGAIMPKKASKEKGV